MQLRTRGIEPFVITLSYDNKLKKNDDIDGILIKRTFASKYNFIRNYFKAGNPVAIFYVIYKNRKKFDILHCEGFNLWALVSAKLLNKRVILEQTLVGQDDVDSLRKQRLGKIKVSIMPLIDRIVCINAKFIEIIKKYKRLNYQLIPNAVDVARFCPVKNDKEKESIRKKLGLPVDMKIVVFSGCIIYRKGIDILIASWDLLARKLSDKEILLLLVGPQEVPLLDNKLFIGKLKHLILKQNLSSKVKFVGKVDNVMDYLKAADIFVFPTRAEGMANALLEAMACGLPCVATELEGVTDSVINNGVNGLLTEVENVEALTEALSKLLTDNQLKRTLGINARNEITKNYQIDEITSKYIELYKKLLKPPAVV
jgi:glycosyltransferase involved in cell wall biosynthesis